MSSVRRISFQILGVKGLKKVLLVVSITIILYLHIITSYIIVKQRCYFIMTTIAYSVVLQNSLREQYPKLSIN